MKFQSDRKDRMVWKAKNFGRYLIAILLLGFVNGVQGQTTLSNSAAQGSFFIKTIQIQGNTLLPESKLSPLVAHLTQSEQALDTLKKGAEAIQKMYRDAGYGGVVAFIPEQKLDDGNVVIQVLEGKLTAVQISGNENLDEANILASLPHLQKNETPVIRDIDRNIQMANENPAKNLRVSLTAGARPGGLMLMSK